MTKKETIIKLIDEKKHEVLTISAGLNLRIKELTKNIRDVVVVDELSKTTNYNLAKLYAYLFDEFYQALNNQNDNHNKFDALKRMKEIVQTNAEWESDAEYQALSSLAQLDKE